ncbi:MAG: zinc ribbon domain-containing protein [Promethearchaeota archaeon]
MRTGTVNLVIVLAISSLILSVIALPLISQTSTILPSRNLVTSDHIWSLNFGVNNFDDAANSIIHCNDGGYLLAGSTWIREDRDILLLRIDESGGILWSNTYGGAGEQIASEVIECETGGFVVIGTDLFDDSTSDVLLIRTSATGEMIWSQRFGGKMNDRGSSLLECQSGGFALAGNTNSYGLNGTNYWLVRTDADGMALWNRTYGGNDDDISHSLIEISPEEGFVIVGSTKSFGAGNSDAWLVRTDALGDVLWQQTIGGYRHDSCQNIIRNQDGDFTIIGITDNTPNLNPSTFVIHFFANGTRKWETTFFGSLENRGYSIIECRDGSFAITGITLNWDYRGGSTNLWLTRLDATGMHQWSKDYGGYYNDAGQALVQAENGDFVLAGTTRSYATGGSDAWILRVPDSAPPTNLEGVYIPPNFLLIALGALLGISILISSLLLYRQSREELVPRWDPIPREVLLQTCFSPRYIEDLLPVLTGRIACSICGNPNDRGNSTCNQCGVELHRCFICNETLGPEDCVIFCPSCSSLAHHEHTRQGFGEGTPCPKCGLCFPTSKTS